MKVLTGEFKGRNFYMPVNIRPTQNMVRKAVFDLLGHDLSGLRVLDLFAGSGALGFEAFSAGAKEVVAVEKDPLCLETIRTNMERFGLGEPRKDGRMFEVFGADVFVTIKMLARQGRKFDVVFLDPPYDAGLAKKTLKTLSAYDILHPNFRIVVEFGKLEGLASCEHDFNEITLRRYGKSCLAIYGVK
ncbi:MAG TPA: 16S rRNA (guanine(966)-N(2))-methyltransferase RsmD [Candidatus Omnitrophota bacterium]|nr:16S rRNA (guanine(966)-N(2))-methyltransferase RsmD [Candidatus Omnitrophota bacterium]